MARARQVWGWDYGLIKIVVVNMQKKKANAAVKNSVKPYSTMVLYFVHTDSSLFLLAYLISQGGRA
jgi:hypothetical protein